METNKNKSALITGGNGFIGAHITNKFVEAGYKVYVICRKGTSNNPKFNENVQNGKIKVFKGDISNFDYSSLPNDINYIIHVAGKVSAYGRMEDFTKTNFLATAKLLDFAKTLKKLECVTYLSSTAVYGYYGYQNLKEDAEKKPFKNPYSISKLQTENMLKEKCEKNKINYVIIRPGNVFGEYDFTSSNEIYGRVKHKKMSICASGKYKSCFVYSGNLANAVFFTSTHKDCYNTDYNVTDGENETLKEYLTLVANAFNVEPKFLNFPAPLAKCVATLVEGTYKLFHIKKAPLITRFSIYQNCADYNFSIQKLLNTGYKKETDFETAILNTANWYNDFEKEQELKKIAKQKEQKGKKHKNETERKHKQ